MKTQYCIGCLNFISDTSKDCENRGIDGEDVKEENVGMRDLRNVRKSKNSNNQREY